MKKWVEVFYTSDIQSFYSVKNLLLKNNIKYKTKVVRNNLRLSMNYIGGSAGLSFGRDSYVKDYYFIFVEIGNLSSVKRLLTENFN